MPSHLLTSSSARELWLLPIFAGSMGLVVGSFLNVVVYRVPRGLSVVWPASRCGWCAGRIRALDNIPILSFLWLSGRCRRCDGPISARYPLVESLTGLLFVALALRWHDPAILAAGAVFVALLVSLAAIDLEHFLLPDPLTFGGMAAGLALQPWIPHASLIDSLIGMLCAAGSLFLLAEIWLWLRGEEGLGLGDAKMAAALGAFLGWQGALVAVSIAAVSGAVTGALLLATRRMGGKSRLPFGLFLAIGGVVTYLLWPEWPIRAAFEGL